MSILDKHHHPDIDLAQGMKILRMCTDELQRRLPIDLKGVSSSPHLTLNTRSSSSRANWSSIQMLVKVLDKDGIREVEYDYSKPVACA